MRNKYFKNLITLFLIISFVAMPLYGIPKKAEAQDLGSLGAYTSGLVPAIAQLPLCRGKLTASTKYLFGQSSAAMTAATEAGQKAIEKAAKNLADEESAAAVQLDAIATYDSVTNKKIDDLKKRLDDVKASTGSLDANDTCLKNIGRLIIKMLLQKITLSTVNWINSGFDGKPAFIQDPGKFFKDIAKNEILQFGLEINNPELFPFGRAWLKNRATYFNNKFADNAVYSLDKLIQETTPQFSANSFWEDFGQGGWGAWMAMTQYPQNNPMGFQIMADDELQRRLEGVDQSAAQNVREALQAADGFLGDQRCVEPKGVTMEEHRAALRVVRRLNPDGTTSPVNPNDPDADKRICYAWEYVTPGKLVAEAATTAINYPNNNLLKADDLNDAVAAILDALLSRFSTNLMNKGFATLGDEGADGTFVYNKDSERADYSSRAEKDFTPAQLTSSWLAANLDFDIRADLTQALIDEQRTYIDKLEEQNKELYSTTDGEDYNMSSFFRWILCAQENGYCKLPDTDTRQVRYGASGKYFYEDITGGVNCNKKTFGDPAKGKKKTCYYSSKAVVNGIQISNADGLIPAINQLDYCIPGPHPGWEEDSRRVLDAVTGVIIPETAESVKNKKQEQLVGAVRTVVSMGAVAGGAAIGGALGSAVPIVGTVVGAAVGAIVGAAVNFIGGLLFGEDNEKKVRTYYDSIIQGLTGIKSDFGKGNDPLSNNISSKQGTVQSLNIILERYIDIARLVYNEKVLPSVHKEATAEFNKLSGYAQMITNNGEKIAAVKNVVNTLGEIKTKIDKLNNKKDSNQIDEENYEKELKPQIDAFGRLSANMINGDDIAEADNLLKEITEKKEYVYKTLLKGPYGCEKELEGKPDAPDKLTTPLYQTERIEYPFPILYTYNAEAGGEIPDPWESGLKNKTNLKATAALGPGFLSFYTFQNKPEKLITCYKNENGEVPPCELKIEDILPMAEPNISWAIREAMGLPRIGERSLGVTKDKGGAEGPSGPFEYTIGVY